MLCRVGLSMAVALVALAAAVPARALDPARQLSQFGHRSWTQQQGLPQDSVRAIAQAPDGALWLGTDEGLARFDGADFRVYRQGADGLPGSLITTLIAARDGSIWVGTLAGVSCLRDGRFTNYTGANGLGTPTVSDLFESADGTIWAVGGRVVTAFRPNAIVNYGPEHGVPAEGLRELVETADGVLLGVGFAEIVRFDGQRFHRHANPAELADAFGASLTLDRNGVLWAGTSRGLVSIDREGHARRYDRPTACPPCRSARRSSIGTARSGSARQTDWPGARATASSASARPGCGPACPCGTSSRIATAALGGHQQRPAPVPRAAVHDVRHSRGVPQRPAHGRVGRPDGHAVDRVPGRRCPRRQPVDPEVDHPCGRTGQQRGVLPARDSRRRRAGVHPRRRVPHRPARRDDAVAHGCAWPPDRLRRRRGCARQSLAGDEQWRRACRRRTVHADVRWRPHTGRRRGQRRLRRRRRAVGRHVRHRTVAVQGWRARTLHAEGRALE